MDAALASIGGNSKALKGTRSKQGRKRSQYQTLTDTQKEFVSVYLETRNAMEAWRVSHPGCTENTARVNGSKALRHPVISAEIMRRQGLRDVQADVSAAKVLKHLWDTSTVDARQMFDSKGNLKNVAEMPETIGRAIQSMDIMPTKQGMKVVRIQLLNKAQQSNTLAKVMRMFDDSPKVGVNIDLRAMPADKLEALESQIKQTLTSAGLTVDQLGTVAKPPPAMPAVGQSNSESSVIEDADFTEANQADTNDLSVAESADGGGGSTGEPGK